MLIHNLLLCQIFLVNVFPVSNKLSKIDIDDLPDRRSSLIIDSRQLLERENHSEHFPQLKDKLLDIFDKCHTKTKETSVH